MTSATSLTHCIYRRQNQTKNLDNYMIYDRCDQQHTAAPCENNAFNSVRKSTQPTTDSLETCLQQHSAGVIAHKAPANIIYAHTISGNWCSMGVVGTKLISQSKFINTRSTHIKQNTSLQYVHTSMSQNIQKIDWYMTKSP